MLGANQHLIAPKARFRSCCLPTLGGFQNSWSDEDEDDEDDEVVTLFFWVWATPEHSHRLVRSFQGKHSPKGSYKKQFSEKVWLEMEVLSHNPTLKLAKMTIRDMFWSSNLVHWRCLRRLHAPEGMVSSYSALIWISLTKLYLRGKQLLIALYWFSVLLRVLRLYRPIKRNCVPAERAARIEILFFCERHIALIPPGKTKLCSCRASGPYWNPVLLWARNRVYTAR